MSMTAQRTTVKFAVLQALNNGVHEAWLQRASITHNCGKRGNATPQLAGEQNAYREA